MDYAVFISYRREGGAHYARILKAELEKRGYRDRVFLDYDELNDGRFDSRIMRAIDSAPVFIFILSPGALDRCVNPDDWVRREIVYAMEKERNIVPVNFDGLFRAFPANLPAEIRNIIGQHQFSKIDSESLLQLSVDKLVHDRIAPIVTPETESPKTENGAEIFVMADAECTVTRFHKPLTHLLPDRETMLRLVKGKHRLEFISTDAPDIKEELLYTVPDNDYSDFLEIKLRDRILEKNTLYPVQGINGLWGYMDKTGKIIIDCEFNEAYPFIEGLARVKNKDGLYGFIDKNGILIIDCKFEDAANFSEGLAAVDEYGFQGFIDKKGILIIDYKFDGAFTFSEGLAAVVNEHGLHGFIDKKGILVIDCKFEEADNFCEGLACVENEDGLYGFIDKKGHSTIGCQFNFAYSFSEGLAAVTNEDWLCGFIDKNGILVIDCKFEDADSFSEGLAAVKNEDGLYGFIDKKGILVIDCQFEDADSFSEGLAAVKNEDGLYGFIDKNGILVIVCQFYETYPFIEGLARVKNKNGDWVYIDKSGKIVRPHM